MSPRWRRAKGGSPRDRPASGLELWSWHGDRELEEELEAHFEGTVQLLVDRGWSEADARAEAQRRFGDLARYRRELQKLQRRRRLRSGARAGATAAWSGVTSSLRGLRRSPGFSAAVIATLALGIGANAAIFRVVDRLLLSPPEHVDDASDVRVLYQTLARAEDGETHGTRSFSYADVVALRRAELPVRLAVVQFGGSDILGEGDSASEVVAARVDSAFFPLVGVRVALGRMFSEEDHDPGAARVALLGHELWKTRFASDPAVLGHAIRLGRGTYEVVGVLPAGFIGALPPSTDVWLPLEASAEETWGAGWEESQNILAFYVLARMGGFDVERFSAEAESIFRRSRFEYGLRGELVEVGTASLIPADGPDNAFGETVPVSRWLAAVSLLVLFAACANVANLLLAQGERTTHETAVRIALGAGRARLGTEILARSLFLALLGAVGAFALAALGGEALESIVFGDVRFAAGARVSRLLVFTAAAAVLAATLSGLLPALVAARKGLRPGLSGGGRSVTGRRGPRRVLIAVQTALSTLLLVGATLFVSSFRAATTKDLGFDMERLIRVGVVRDEVEPVLLPQIYEQAESLVRSVPGVLAAARTVAVPFERSYGLQGQLPAGEAREGSSQGEVFAVNAVGTDFFETMGVPLLRGRGIEAADLAPGAEPVSVVSLATAARLWPEREALGRCLQVGSAERVVPCARVVGVAGDHAQRELAEAATMNAWVPLTLPAVRAAPVLMVRVDGEPERFVSPVRQRMLAIPGVRFADVTPMTDVSARLFRSWELGATVFSLFALIALGVAGVGLYGLLSYEVAQRRREIGIRVALGAHRASVLGHVLRGAFSTVALGLLGGLLVAAWGARRLESLLFEASSRDPKVFLLAALSILAIATAAAFLPAWRAARVDPRESLSAE